MKDLYTIHNTFAFIVVIYNKVIESVPIYTFLHNLSLDNVHLDLCDNSDCEEIKQHNIYICTKIDQCHYIDMGGNRGYSRACNEAIRRSKEDVVCIFDDDTIIPYNYITVVDQYICSTSNSDTIYVPYVTVNSKTLSPLFVIGPMIVHAIGKIKVPSRICSAINTGMAFRRDVFLKIQYDENLFLDYVDHAFCRSARQHGIQFIIMPEITLKQSYSKYTNTLSDALKRETILENDIRKYYDNGIIDRLYCSAYLIYRKLYRSIKYRTLEFFSTGNNIENIKSGK